MEKYSEEEIEYLTDPSHWLPGNRPFTREELEQYNELKGTIMNEDFNKDSGVVGERVPPFEVLYDGPARGEYSQRAEDLGDEGEAAVPVKLSEEDRDLLRAIGDSTGDDGDEGDDEDADTE